MVLLLLLRRSCSNNTSRHWLALSTTVVCTSTFILPSSSFFSSTVRRYFGSTKNANTTHNAAMRAKLLLSSASLSDDDDGSVSSSSGRSTTTSSSSSWKVYPSYQYEALVERYGKHKIKVIYMIRHAEGTHNLVENHYDDPNQMDARLTPRGRQQCATLQQQLLALRTTRRGTDTSTSTTGTATGTEVETTTATAVEIDQHLETRTTMQQRDATDLDNEKQEQQHTWGLQYLMKNDDSNNTNEDGTICVMVSPLTRCIQTAVLSFEFLVGNDKDHNRSVAGIVSSPVFVACEELRETVNYKCDQRRTLSEISHEYPLIDFSHCAAKDEDALWFAYRQREQQQPHGVRCMESAELYRVAERGRTAFQWMITTTTTSSSPISARIQPHATTESATPNTHHNHNSNHHRRIDAHKVIICTHSAYLRCILNWGQTGGVPKMWKQQQQEQPQPSPHKLFDYCYYSNDKNKEATTTTTAEDDPTAIQTDTELEQKRAVFEEYMRKDYENTELRSFCLRIP